MGIFVSGGMPLRFSNVRSRIFSKFKPGPFPFIAASTRDVTCNSKIDIIDYHLFFKGIYSYC